MQKFKKFIFNTIITIKDKNYWIDRDIIAPVVIKAENLDKALEKYAEMAKKYDINVTKTALKNKKEMFVDDTNGSTQIGYVLTASREVLNHRNTWVRKYIELWVEIFEVKNPFRLKIA